MSRLIVIGTVAAASAALLTGTAAAVGVVATKSQTASDASTNSQVRVVAPAAAVQNDTVKKAINVASATPSSLPPVKVKHIVVHPGSNSNGSTTTASKPRVVITTRTIPATPGHKKTIIITTTVTASPTPGPTASPTTGGHHEDGGDGHGEHHNPNPSGTPTHGGGDD